MKPFEVQIIQASLKNAFTVGVLSMVQIIIINSGLKFDYHIKTQLTHLLSILII